MEMLLFSSMWTCLVGCLVQRANTNTDKMFVLPLGAPLLSVVSLLRVFPSQHNMGYDMAMADSLQPLQARVGCSGTHLAQGTVHTPLLASWRSCSPQPFVVPASIVTEVLWPLLASAEATVGWNGLRVVHRSTLPAALCGGGEEIPSFSAGKS